MASTTKAKTENLYSKENHATWEKYFKRQKALVSKLACKEFITGSKKLGLDAKHVPNRNAVSERLRRMTGWTLSNAGNKNVSIEDWFIAMRKREFPVTDFIRPPEHFDYTSKPDLLHEYFGHLPFLTDKKFAKLAQKFGTMCKKANRRQLMQISRIWSLCVEFGLVKERGKVKLLGAGLLSSYGEAKFTAEKIKKGDIIPFDLHEVINTAGRTYEWHKKIFVMESISQIDEALTVYGKKEGLL